MLDLSGLEVSVLGDAEQGKPLELALADIDEDPDQPRKEFAAAAMAEMTASIKARGVKTPVSVRPNPEKPGRWILNYGARRFRASLAAGKTTIPAFIDEDHGDYDQVIENLQRDDLKPMELALFIHKKLTSGVKKAEIARNLSIDKAVVTHHLALIDPPACIEAIYVSGRCISPKTLYELRGLHSKHPDKVDAWCAQTNDITRKTVADLAAVLESDSDRAEEQTQGNNTKSVGHDQHFEQAAGEVGGADALRKAIKSEIRTTEFIKSPLLLVEFEGRAAKLLLSRRPSTPGLVYIRFEDGGGDVEVDASQCKINLLMDAAE